MESYLKSDLGAPLQGFNRVQTRGGKGVISKPDLGARPEQNRQWDAGVVNQKPDLGARPGFNRTDNGMRGW